MLYIDYPRPATGRGGIRVSSIPVRRLDIYDSIEPPTCTSCGRIIHPNERATTFYCPNCGIGVIRRCSRCRAQGAQYTCPNCGFTGP